MKRGRTKLIGRALLPPAAIAIGVVFPCHLAHASCQLKPVGGDVPIVMVGPRPTLVGWINGVQSTFILDSGDWYSHLSSAKAAELKLPHMYVPGPRDYSHVKIKMGGFGGEFTAWVATVKHLRILNTEARNMDFFVGGKEFEPGISGLIGQNILRVADVEYDLAHGVVRLFHETGCERSPLAYWSGSQPYSIADIDKVTPLEPHTIAAVLLNGSKIKAVLDTGAPTSFITLHAAESASFRPDQPGVESAGLTPGVGAKGVRTWIAPFASLKVGDEEIKNGRLRVGDYTLSDGDMLLGADFFLSHRIFVASSLNKMFFTYNGGPVFNLSHSREQGTATAAEKPASPAEPDTPSASRDESHPN